MRHVSDRILNCHIHILFNNNTSLTEYINLYDKKNQLKLISKWLVTFIFLNGYNFGLW